MHYPVCHSLLRACLLLNKNNHNNYNNTSKGVLGTYFKWLQVQEQVLYFQAKQILLSLNGLNFFGHTLLSHIFLNLFQSCSSASIGPISTTLNRYTTKFCSHLKSKTAQGYCGFSTSTAQGQPQNCWRVQIFFSFWVGGGEIVTLVGTKMSLVTPWKSTQKEHVELLLIMPIAFLHLHV